MELADHGFIPSGPVGRRGKMLNIADMDDPIIHASVMLGIDYPDWDNYSHWILDIPSKERGVIFKLFFQDGWEEVIHE